MNRRQLECREGWSSAASVVYRRQIDSEEHTLLCGPCYQSLFKGTVQALPCALGKLVKIPRDDGKGFVIRLRDGESASENLVDAEKPKAQLAIEDVQNNVPAPAPAPLRWHVCGSNFECSEQDLPAGPVPPAGSREDRAACEKPRSAPPPPPPVPYTNPNPPTNHSA